MKRILLSIALFSSVHFYSQTVIVEEKFEKNNEPVNFQYLPISKKLVIFKGYSTSFAAGLLTTNAVSFDTDGKKNVLFQDQKLRVPTFSITENLLKAYDGTKNYDRPDHKYLHNNTVSTIDYKTLDDISSFYFGFYDRDNYFNRSQNSSARVPFDASFNDFYEFGFTNQKENEDINFIKDDVFLEVIEIKTNSKKRFQITKPDLALLNGDAFAKDEFKTTFHAKLNGNENFDLITKSVSSDSKKTIIYRDTYDFEGKILKKFSLNLNLSDKFFIVSNNKGGFLYESPSSGMQRGFKAVGTSSINNFIEDRANGDLYVYGIFSDKAPNRIDGLCNPSGFYVYKFDKNGTKLWESFQYIKDKEFFEKVKSNSYLSVDLFEYNKELVFSISVNAFTEFSYSTIVNKSTGELSKTNFIEYNRAGNKAISNAFISHTYVNDIRNKVFSQITFVAMITNPEVAKYINSVPEKGNRLYYETIFSDQGIWLIETDNKEYYKILLFKE